MKDHRAAKARAETVRIARARLQINQMDLALAAGLDQTTISKAEHGTASFATYDIIDRALARLEPAS